MIFPAIPLAINAIGVICFYLSSPHQRLLARPASPALRRAGGVLLVLDPFVWSAWLHLSAAVCVTFVIAMSGLGLLPWLGLLRKKPAPVPR